jgi:hypothetical protein
MAIRRSLVIEDCRRSVRRMILGYVDEMKRSEWPDVIPALHDELNDLKKVIEERSKEAGP